MNFYTFLGIHRVESKRIFENKVYAYYSTRSNGAIPPELLRYVGNIIAAAQYNWYKQSWMSYRKSRKRYAKFKEEDLVHPQVHKEIIELLKKKYPEKYLEYSGLFLEMTSQEVLDFIKNQKLFNAMF